MIQVTQSPFLQALGYAIINSLWQYALLWLIYYLVSSITGISSHKLYVLALICHLTGFVWFCGTIVYYYTFCLHEANFAAMALPERFRFELVATETTIRQKIYLLLLRSEQFLPYLSLAYMALLGFMSVKTIKAYRQTILIRSSALLKPPVEWRLFSGRLSMQFGIKKKVTLFLSTLVESPVTIGFFKPLILLPVSIINNLSIEQVEAVLIHELAHIKRHDYLVNLLLSFIEIALFFNPFMRLISRNINRERENSCDDRVLQFQYNAASYAHALLKIASSKFTHNPSMSIGAVDSNRALLIRVKRMIERKESDVNYRQQLIALASMTAIFCSLAWFTPKKQPVFAASLPARQRISSQEISEFAKTDNPLFNPVYFLSKPIKAKMFAQAVKETELQTAPVKIVLPAVASPNQPINNQPQKINEAQFAFESSREHQDFKDFLLPDSSRINKEFEALLQNKVMDTRWEKMQSDLQNIRQNLLEQNKMSWNVLVNTNVATTVERALSHLNNLQIHLNTREKHIRIVEKSTDKKLKEKYSALREEYEKAEEDYAQLLGQAKHLKESRQSLMKAAEANPLSAGLPAIMIKPAIKSNPAFSYEYKEMPKSQIVIASELPTYESIQPLLDFNSADEPAEIRETSPAVPKTHRTEVKKIRRLTIVHI